MAFEQPLPQYLSPSRLADFQACPRRYQHASIDRIAQPATYATLKGRFIHYIMEHLFLLERNQRTLEHAREFVTPAIEEVITEEVRSDLQLDDATMAKLLSETESALVRYFSMEDPTEIVHEGVELRLRVDVDGTPLYGILDRLDRQDDGTLAIVDYKTGSLPNRNYDSQTFANTELYAALCTEKLGEQPSTIRLLYVAHGTAINRDVTQVVVRARTGAATNAWKRINRYYADGNFPATPSPNACRFCAYQDRCREAGVPVPRR
jgi:putative RecB family exonuclease